MEASFSAPRLVTLRHGLAIVKVRRGKAKAFRVARMLGAQGQEGSLEWLSGNLWPTREKAERELHALVARAKHALRVLQDELAELERVRPALEGGWPDAPEEEIEAGFTAGFAGENPPAVLTEAQPGWLAGWYAGRISFLQEQGVLPKPLTPDWRERLAIKGEDA
ncbi:hypothetical protein [Meiothermus sp. Pnk-1]|uniref:hypothetical protein n=1 Tax=Meiothermus sp. Pnk-1 TaxID=873128 RepID=UPI0011B6D021|nr:hypothetical protein [Meiothermus sp. Pnk-1]